ncbi:hypothetical protein HANVADRAFT_109651 [Hanseniaspora valbyensis NRRL Y-1626]|uniref:Uncharacterized protein n=1 Tax=Hanseniaspora valbyensis NRRL Y-1626 TaxID=766949 RepID=A0A1B7TGH3_9ASCO|nr:hypothetical protein HANVADRAFT_109651 [Hanseniaspora valbyensis NRRL Y-1626]
MVTRFNYKRRLKEKKRDGRDIRYKEHSSDSDFDNIEKRFESSSDEDESDEKNQFEIDNNDIDLIQYLPNNIKNNYKKNGDIYEKFIKLINNDENKFFPKFDYKNINKENEIKEDEKDKENKESSVENEVIDEESMKRKIIQLEQFVEQSKLYSQIIKQQLREEQDQISQTSAVTKKQKLDKSNTSFNKRHERAWQYPLPSLLSKDIIVKDYQREGYEWLISLYSNGLNGLLSDEMGLGKTLQILLLISFIWEMEDLENAPDNNIFLVVVPLSTIDNWVNEIDKFVPNLPKLKYYDKETRQSFWNKKNNNRFKGGVLITSYQVVMNDIENFATMFNIKYLIIDEGHRLKNLDCKLINCLNRINLTNGNKILITGTPLQNNLKELWSLLNFIMPSIFNDFESFNKWFEYDDDNNNNGGDTSNGVAKNLITKMNETLLDNLHSILEPFMLRRLKKNVFTNGELPFKKEFLINCPLDLRQKRLYNQLTNNSYDNYRIYFFLDATCLFIRENRNFVFGLNKLSDDLIIEYLKYLYLKLNKNPMYQLQDNFKDYFELFTKMDSVIFDKHIYLQMKNTLSNNAQMQKRHLINNPFIIFNPYYFYDDYSQFKNFDQFVNLQGNKFKKLNFLLPLLLAKKHKVLIFTQFVKNIQLLTDYLILSDIKFKVLTGTTKNQERSDDIKEFQDKKSDYNVYLISTRAGGLGINLTAADSIILYDSDWNPTIDKQAIDRSHRIGQTSNVAIYRLFCEYGYELQQFGRIISKNEMNEIVVENGNFNFDRKISDFKEKIEPVSGKQLGIDIATTGFGFEVKPDDYNGTDDDFTVEEKKILLDRSDKSYNKNNFKSLKNLPNIKFFESNI